MKVLRGGRIVTCDPARPPADAVAIEDGRIVAIGEDVRAAGAEVVDLEGATVLPGLVDTHPHVMHFGVLAEPLVDLSDAVDHADIVARIAAKARRHAGGRVDHDDAGRRGRTTSSGARGAISPRASSRTARCSTGATGVHPVIIQAWAPTTPNVLVFNSAGLARLGVSRATRRTGSSTSGSRRTRRASRPARLRGLGQQLLHRRALHRESCCGSCRCSSPTAIGPGTERAMRRYNAMGVTDRVRGPRRWTPADRRLPVAARRANRLTMRVLCCPRGASPTACRGTRRSTRRRVRRSGSRRPRRSSTRDDDLCASTGVTISRGGPCWPGFLLMREPYRGPDGEPTTGDSFVPRERARPAIAFAHERGLRLNVVTAGTAEHDEYLDRARSGVDRRPASRGRARVDLAAPLLRRAGPGTALRGARASTSTTSMSFSWGKGEHVRRADRRARAGAT